MIIDTNKEKGVPIILDGDFIKVIGTSNFMVSQLGLQEMTEDEIKKYVLRPVFLVEETETDDNGITTIKKAKLEALSLVREDHENK